MLSTRGSSLEGLDSGAPSRDRSASVRQLDQRGGWPGR